MITKDLNSGQVLKMTKIIFFSLISGLLIFLIMVLYAVNKKFLFNVDLSDPLMLSNFILSCIFLTTGYLFTKMIFRKIDQNESTRNKLSKYKSGQIIRLATCEGIGMLAIASLLLTSNLFFLIFLLIALMIMIQYYPAPAKIGREINLTPTEIDMFND